MRIKRTLATVAAAALATTGLVACSNESDDTADNAAGNNGDNVTVKIGTTEADQEAWRVFKDLAKDNGISLSDVEAIAGKKAIERTPKGQFIQLNGQWLQK